MKRYDFIFAGGGLAGLSLAYDLAHSPLRDRSMLIIDHDAKTRNDRTWCFWADQATPFDGIACREWNRIHLASEDWEQDLDLGDYRYRMIRGIDFYQFTRQELAACGNVEFLQGTVETIEDGADCARVTVDGRVYAGRWVFDSRLNLKEVQANSAGAHYLQQYFKGWEIETTRVAFRPVPTLLDFRAPQQGAMRFFYVLPLSERRALVEYVTLDKDDHDLMLATYIERVCKIQDYAVVAAEGGVNPMTDHVFPRRAGNCVMNIGARGGRIKATTGYAFVRIQHDSAAIVRSLLRTGTPFQVPPDSRRYRLHDSLMLDVMRRNGGQIESILTALFKNNPTERVLRFLDEKASPAENLLLMLSLPPWIFVQAMLRMKLFREP